MSSSGCGTGGGAKGASGGNGGYGGRGGNDDDGRAGRRTKRTHKARLNPFQTFMEELGREAEKPPELDTRPCPFASTPEFRTLEARQTVPAGPSSARPTPSEI